MKSKKWKLQPLSKGTSGGGTGKIASNIHRPPSAAAVAQRQVFLCRREKTNPPIIRPFQPIVHFRSCATFAILNAHQRATLTDT